MFKYISIWIDNCSSLKREMETNAQAGVVCNTEILTPPAVRLNCENFNKLLEFCYSILTKCKSWKRQLKAVWVLLGIWKPNNLKSCISYRNHSWLSNLYFILINRMMSRDWNIPNIGLIIARIEINSMLCRKLSLVSSTAQLWSVEG